MTRTRRATARLETRSLGRTGTPRSAAIASRDGRHTATSRSGARFNAIARAPRWSARQSGGKHARLRQAQASAAPVTVGDGFDAQCAAVPMIAAYAAGAGNPAWGRERPWLGRASRWLGFADLSRAREAVSG